MQLPLFRKEVIESKKQHYYGSVFVNIPVKYQMITVGVSLLMGALILFFIFAEFSEKFTVSGYLNSTQVVTKVYPKMNGIIVESYCQEGDKVKKGDKLLLVDTSHEGINQRDNRALVEQLQKRKSLIAQEVLYKTQYVRSLEKLMRKNFISRAEYHAKKEELLELENKKSLIDIEIIQQQQSASYMVRAPIDGIISNLHYGAGQYTNLAKPLIKIIPEKAELYAELFIPARKIGAVEQNNKILLRYDAYPYQYFGSYPAAIKNIGQSIMTDKEEEKPFLIGEPYYKVTARLTQQVVMMYGKKKRIQHGMTLTAVVVGTKRKLWQWVLEPLFSYYGTLLYG